MRTGNALVPTNQPKEPSRPVAFAPWKTIGSTVKIPVTTPEQRAKMAAMQRAAYANRNQPATAPQFSSQHQDDESTTFWMRMNEGTHYELFRTRAVNGEIDYWYRRG